MRSMYFRQPLMSNHQGLFLMPFINVTVQKGHPQIYRVTQRKDINNKVTASLTNLPL